MLKKKEFFTIFIIMVTETLGFSLILPFLPFYAQDLGASPLTIGLILTSFSLFQFFSAPIMGRLSDIYGRKPLLIISQISTLIGFVILGFANNIFLVFLSRIVDGLFGSNFTIAQAYLSDVSSKEDRSKAFGISGAAFGFGFLIGPALGGFLAQISYSIPAFVAAGVTTITIFLTASMLKETVQKDPANKFKLSDIKLLDLRVLEDVKGNKKLISYITLFITFMFSHSIFVSSFALFGERKLGFGVAETGMVLAFVGIVNVILRGVLLEKMIDKFKEHSLLFWGTISMAVAYLLLSLANAPWVFYTCILLFAFGGGVTRPLVLGEVSRNVSDKKQGAMMGALNSIGSISQIISPLVGGYILNYYKPGVLPLISLLVFLIGFKKSKFLRI